MRLNVAHDALALGLRVSMASHGTLAYDRRVQLEAITLAKAGHSVTLFCTEAGGPLPASLTDLVEVVQVGRGPGGSGASSSPLLATTVDRTRLRILVRVRRSLAAFRWLRAYRASLTEWGQAVVARGQATDVWHLHDLPALLAIAPRLPPEAAFVYDSHEIFVESGSAARLPRLARRWLRRREGLLARRARGVVTVNEACAEELAKLRPRQMIVVHNCPPRWTPSGPRVDRLRALAGIGQGSAVVLYHGTFGQHRGIEELVAAISRPELATAHLVFLGRGALRATMNHLAALPEAAGRVHLLDAVLPDELPSWIASADVEAMPIQNSTLNHYLSTPNKLFEAIAVGCPVVVSDFPAMRQIVLDDPAGPLGAACDPTDPKSIAMAIKAILDLDPAARKQLRARCLEAAHRRWNWEHEGQALVALYERLALERSQGGTLRS